MKSAGLTVDSSVWLEVLMDGPLAKACLQHMEGVELIFVPTVVLFEVYRKIAASHSEELALSALAHLKQHSVVDLNSKIAVEAADLSRRHRIGMADSIVLAHAEHAGTVLITLDNDFAGIPRAIVLR